MQLVIATDEDATPYLVALAPQEDPEEWTVELHTDDGEVQPLDGERYGMFPSLWHRHQDLFAWCLPSATGRIAIDTADGWHAERHWAGSMFG